MTQFDKPTAKIADRGSIRIGCGQPGFHLGAVLLGAVASLETDMTGQPVVDRLVPIVGRSENNRMRYARGREASKVSIDQSILRSV